MSALDDQAILAQLDQWAGLAHKNAMGTSPQVTLAPTWVPAADRRRLAAYTILAAYRANVARTLLDADTDQKNERREYGDADLLITRISGAVLGDAPQIVVEGATGAPDDTPDLPPEPDDPGDTATDLERRIYQTRHRRWTDTVTRIIDDWETAWATYPQRVAQQAALNDWATVEQLDGKLLEWNSDAVGLGDGIIELAISTRHQRPIVTVYDPGFYFPILDDAQVGDYPTTVHLAWEYTDHDDERWVRRRTYQLVDIRELPTDPDQGPAAPRRYPWAPDTDSWTTCLFSDARWRIADIGEHAATDLDPSQAIFAATETGDVADRIDLGLDFIPIVHMPNSPANQTHFGTAALTGLAQLLDDIHEADSDKRLAMGLAAVPIIATSGSEKLPDDLAVEPGLALWLGTDGRLDVVDMAASLPALQAGVDALLDRLAVNSRVSSEVMGRVDAANASSGFAMQLAFGPFTQLVGDLRLTRNHKHALFLKFACRMLQLCGRIDPGELAPARVVLGSFLPSDIADVVARVTSLLGTHAISRQTALDMLIGAGLSVDDAEGELDRIRAENTGAAKEAAEATGSDQIGADWLGVELPVAAPPAVVLPPVQL